MKKIYFFNLLFALIIVATMGQKVEITSSEVINNERILVTYSISREYDEFFGSIVGDNDTYEVDLWYSIDGNAFKKAISVSYAEESIKNIKVGKGKVLTWNVINDISRLVAKKVDIELRVKSIDNRECALEKFGTVSIFNRSANPYSLYEYDSSGNKKLLKILKGRSTEEINFPIGYYFLYAIQNSGFFVYPTINYRSISITKACEKYNIEVGFEDGTKKEIFMD